MYGPAPAPPPVRPPHRGGRAWRLVLWLALGAVSVGSIGFLSWVPVLVLAVWTRRRRDWVCAGVVLALVCAAVVVLAKSDAAADDWEANTGVPVLLLLAIASPVYCLFHYPRYPAAGAYPQVNPYTLGMSLTPPYPVVPYPAVPPPVSLDKPVPPPPPAPLPPPAGRIDEVRAGLDELSAYLREQEPEE